MEQTATSPTGGGGEPPEDLAGFARRCAWLSRPTVWVEVDATRDLVLATALAQPADVEILLDPGVALGFGGPAQDALLTTLCVQGLDRWGRAGDAALREVRGLLGPRVSSAVDELRGGGSTCVDLDPADGADLALRWRAFVRAGRPPSPPAGLPA